MTQYAGYSESETRALKALERWEQLGSYAEVGREWGLSGYRINQLCGKARVLRRYGPRRPWNATQMSVRLYNGLKYSGVPMQDDGSFNAQDVIDNCSFLEYENIYKGKPPNFGRKSAKELCEWLESNGVTPPSNLVVFAHKNKQDPQKTIERATSEIEKLAGHLDAQTVERLRRAIRDEQETG